MHKKILTTILLIIVLITSITCYSFAVEEKDANTNKRYTVIIEDDADLLTNIEEQELKKQMEILSEFGNVLFKTTNTAINSTSLRYIQNYYYAKWGNESGVGFYIDMKNRQVCACATGNLDKIITSAKCDTIMDNVYTYAKRGNYYKCALETYTQMNKLLNGEKIAESMKYICNAIISIMLSCFISYGFFVIISKNKKASKEELINECTMSLKHSPIEAYNTGSHKVYSPRDSGSSGGGGFSGGGSSSGGGGFSGSGGSHGF